VIVPAYGCPDLVSAAVFAGLSVRLVDNAPDVWGYDEIGFARALSDKTAAVLSVNLLGVTERSELIRKYVGRDRIIVDNAQSLQLPLETCDAEFMVLSFGRGKPLNLLGGGLLVSERKPVGLTAWPRLGFFKDAVASSWPAALVFNRLTRPEWFSLLTKLPGSTIGTTQYHHLGALRQLPARALSRIGPALKGYATKSGYNANVWRDAVWRWREFGIIELVGADGARAPDARLRLALLAPDRALRDRIVNALTADGLGATAMYGRPLPEISSVPEQIRAQGPFTNASKLADGLFTLPTHEFVNAKTVRRTDEIIAEIVTGNC
jgi:hypothetical protein